MHHSPMILKKLRKVPSFVHHRDIPEFQEPVPSPSFEAKFYAGEERQFKLEWDRLQKAVFELYRSYKKAESDGYRDSVVRMPKGMLAVLHDDVHILMRSKAGSFVFDFFQKRILPAATQILYEDIVEIIPSRKMYLDSPKVSPAHRLSLPAPPKPHKVVLDIKNLTRAWKHFYSHILPDLEMIFAQIKSHSQETARTAALVSFRDEIVMDLEPQLTDLLYDHRQIKKELPTLRHMLLILQSVYEDYPPTKNKLRLEKLVALVVSPYLGHYGLYHDFCSEPTISSNELSVAHLRRLSIVDPRKLSRPLSMHSNKPLETLQDLFVLSADRTRHHHHRSKNGNKEGRKRSVSTSEEFFMGTLGY